MVTSLQTSFQKVVDNGPRSKKYGIFILKIISKYKPVYSQSTNPCKAILLEYIPTF